MYIISLTLRGFNDIEEFYIFYNFRSLTQDPNFSFLCLSLRFPSTSSFLLSHYSSNFLFMHFILFFPTCCPNFSPYNLLSRFPLFIHIFHLTILSILPIICMSDHNFTLSYLRSSWSPSSLTESLSWKLSSSSPNENRNCKLYHNISNGLYGWIWYNKKKL